MAPDYVLRFCGCANVTVINDFGDPDGVFGPDDTWIVQSRFFQRAGGFAEVSGAFGGSASGFMTRKRTFASRIQSQPARRR